MQNRPPLDPKGYYPGKMTAVGILLGAATVVFLAIALAVPGLNTAVPFILGGALASGLGLFSYMNRQKHEYEEKQAEARARGQLQEPEQPTQRRDHPGPYYEHHSGQGHDHGYGHDYGHNYGNGHSHTHGYGHDHERGSWAQSVIDSRDHPVDEWQR